jgi:hypothetical protein
MRLVGHVKQIEIRCAYRLLVKKIEGRRPPGKPSAELKEILREGVNCIHLVQARLLWLAV